MTKRVAINGFGRIGRLVFRQFMQQDDIGSTYSALVDAPSTMVLRDNEVKVLAWYDNDGATPRVWWISLATSPTIPSGNSPTGARYEFLARTYDKGRSWHGSPFSRRGQRRQA